MDPDGSSTDPGGSSIDPGGSSTDLHGSSTNPDGSSTDLLRIRTVPLTDPDPNFIPRCIVKAFKTTSPQQLFDYDCITLHSVQCTLYSVHCTVMYTVQPTAPFENCKYH